MVVSFSHSRINDGTTLLNCSSLFKIMFGFPDSTEFIRGSFLKLNGQ